MIVETNSLLTVGVGASKVQTEPGDTVIKLPNLIMPVLEVIEPSQIAPTNSQVMLSSFVRHTFAYKTNDPGGSAVVGTFGKGLWIIRLRYIVRQLLAAAVPFNSNNYTMTLTSPVGGISCNLVSLLPVQSGTFEVSAERRVLLRENGEVRVVWGPTAVGDFLDYNVELSCDKLL